jgi:hypothetical protein
MTGHDPSEIFNFVNESLDRVAGFVELLAEAERVLSIGFRQNVTIVV